MTKAFVLSITLGNDAMQDQTDVADALVRTAAKVLTSGPLDFDGPHKIYDLNGEPVGSWSVQGADNVGARS